MLRPRVEALLVGLGISFATAVLMLATEPRLAIGWDEGYTLGREARLRDWFRGLRDPARLAAGWRPLPAAEGLVQPARGGSPPPRPRPPHTRRGPLVGRPALAS